MEKLAVECLKGSEEAETLRPAVDIDENYPLSVMLKCVALIDEIVCVICV